MLLSFCRTMERGMTVQTKCVATLLILQGCFSWNGCVAPHYTNRQIIISGKAAPEIIGTDTSAIQRNLSTKPARSVNLLAVATGFITTPLKCIGLQGWKDYQLQARACGTVVQRRNSSDRFLTVDLRLRALKVNDRAVRLLGPRFVRLEIFLGKVPVNNSTVGPTKSVLIANGKLVWDTDGWFEIHPQEASDLRRASSDSRASN